MAAGKGKQFLLLFWKNWIIQKRKICCTITEILIPVLLALLLLALRQLTTSERQDVSRWRAFNVDSLPDKLMPDDRGSGPEMTTESGSEFMWAVAYTPDNPVTRRIMQQMAAQINVNVTGTGYLTEKAMREALIVEDSSSDNMLGGIVFTSSFANDELANKVKYKIRLPSISKCVPGSGGCDTEEDRVLWFTDIQFSQSPELGPRFEDDFYDSDRGYYTEGFLAIQLALDRAIMMEHSPNLTMDELQNIQILLQRYPYPEWIDDPFVNILQTQLPLFLVIIFLCSAPLITKDIVLEKERKLKETMKLMGLAGWLHWAAWFIKYFVFLLIPVIVMTIAYSIDLGNGAVVNKMDPSLLFVFFLLYMISVIMFSFAVSVFFSAANTAAAASGILFFLTYIPYTFFTFQYYSISVTTKLLCSLLPNVAMSFCCVLIAFQEATGVGMQWSNFYKPVNVNDDLTLAYMFMMLILDIFICFIIVWYVEAIKPGDFGVPMPWYFPFTKWYWCGNSQPSDEEIDMNINMNTHQHEPIPEGQTPGARIRGLRKVFNARSKNPRVAVDSLDFDMIEGQITALLGHNGAGKTTTMFMLTGFLEPTRGNAVIGGYDIRKNLSKVRENLGLCPQHDVLFDVLTVREHLEFFGRLKGCKDLDGEVKDMIDLLHLRDKTNVQSQNLSGGMKRKLCVGIALIGGSKVIILDEPTSGMDPEARRHTWDILQKARRGRTMLLTTHFMDEADYLGDRIGIMSKGKLVCSGTSLFLKKRYGVGYHMNMVKREDCDSQAVANLVRQYVPEAGLESDAGAELSFVLPHESSPRFEELFNTIEAQKGKLGINSWGASVTTMEEVFLKVGDEEHLQEVDRNGYQNPDYHAADNVDGGSIHYFRDERVHIDFPAHAEKGARNYNLNTHSPATPKTNGRPRDVSRHTGGIFLYLQQLRSMFMKRVLNSWRSPIVSIVQLTIPFIFALLGCIVELTLPDTTDPTALTLEFNNFDEPISAYKGVANGETVIINDMKNEFKSYMQDQNVQPSDVTSGSDFRALEDYLLDLADEDLQTFINNDIVSGYFEGNPGLDVNATPYVDTDYLAKGLFNNEALHASPMALMSLSNTILRYLMGSEDYSIEATNHPLPLPASFQAEEDLNQQRSVAFIIAFNTAFGMAFLIATFVTFLIKEREIKAKHCQYTSGVPVSIFWAGTYFWDLINFMIPCLAILILFAAFDIEGYIVGNNLGVTFLLFLLYGMSVLPFVYLISFLFDVAATGYVIVAVINIITGMVATLTVFILKIIGSESAANTADVLEWAFYVLLPNFCFSNGLQELYNNYSNEQLCKQVEENTVETMIDLGIPPALATFDNYCEALPEESNPCCLDKCGAVCADYASNDIAWKSPGVGRAVLFMILQTIAYFTVIFFLESGIAKSIKQRMMSAYMTSTATDPHRVVMQQVGPQGVPITRSVSVQRAREDDDVEAERHRIESSELPTLFKTDSLVLRKLTKFYGGFQAVDNLSIGIKQGECFGLLGVNGAGKTTTFKMLTGDETISGGHAYVTGYDVSSQIKQVQQRVGYCPQFDALIEKLTVQETLTMYARLRGVYEDEIDAEVMRLIDKLLLSEYTKKLAGDLSGGNKRKLSTAIALVGNPPIVFLDEPTTGMDPVARRQLWNALVETRQAGRTIVLTSHSMEECEALCTRLVIMVNGQFKCTGSSQHLKDKFGEGFALMAKVTPGAHQMETEQRTANMMHFIEQQFPGCILKDSHPGLVLYQISSAHTTLAQVFGIMERNKDALFIEDYSVSQTTLEQVFINFARAQRPPLEDTMKCTFCSCMCCCQ